MPREMYVRTLSIENLEVIKEAQFPKELRKGEKIVGTVILQNPFEHEATMDSIVITRWNWYDYGIWAVVPPRETITFNFPNDYTWQRHPADAPDPVMPNKDAILYVHGSALDRVTGEYKTARKIVTIKLHKEWWEKIAEWWNSLPAWQKILIASSLPVSVATILAFKRR